MPEYDYARLRAYLKNYLDHFAFETGLGGLHVEAENVQKCPDEMLPAMAAQYGINVDAYRLDTAEHTPIVDDGPDSYFGFRRR